MEAFLKYEVLRTKYEVRRTKYDESIYVVTSTEACPNGFHLIQAGETERSGYGSSQVLDFSAPSSVLMNCV